MSTPAGWYDDGSGKQRWWDGSQWTDQFQTPEPAGNGHDGLVPLMEFVSHIDGKNAKVWIYGDRVEYERKVGVSAGKITAGVLTGGMSLAVTGVGKGAYGAGGKRKQGTEVIPIKAVTSVTTRRDGMINTIVSIATAAGVINMRVHHDEAERAKMILTDLILQPSQQTVNVQFHAPQATPPTPAAAAPTMDIGAQLAQLGQLRDAGVLTEDEFNAKKAELLARL